MSKNLPILYKELTQAKFVDYYCVWGSGNVQDSWDGFRKKLNTKIIYTGSYYLSNLNKWKKEKISENNLTLLYPANALFRAFPESLESPNAEEIFNHSKVIVKFIKKLLIKYYNLKILYKTFPGNQLINDLFRDTFSKGPYQKRVKIIDLPPIKIMPSVDIVFFDVISTGFAEALSIGVPTFVLDSKYDYNRASLQGRKINNQLKKSGIICYDEKSGLKSFQRIVKNLDSFKKITTKPIQKFQKAIAYPVTKKEFLNNLNQNI